MIAVCASRKVVTEVSLRKPISFDRRSLHLPLTILTNAATGNYAVNRHTFSMSSRLFMDDMMKFWVCECREWVLVFRARTYLRQQKIYS